MVDRDALRWLAQEGHRALNRLKVEQSKPVKINWADTSWQTWQEQLLEEQVRFRMRCHERFPNPEKWLWTDRSLQQASDWSSAVFKASLFESGLRVLDACCGAGADLVALAADHEVVGLDRDRHMLWLAHANLHAHEREGRLCQGEVTTSLGRLARVGLHIDPDRRTGEGRSTRTTQGDAFSPSLAESMGLGQAARAAVIKLAPATQLSEIEAARSDWRRCWLGSQRECPQQLLVRGEASIEIPDGHVAAVLLQRELPPLVYSGAPMEGCGIETEPAEYIYEPIPSLYAAGLAPLWATQHNLSALSTPRGYFTGDEFVSQPFAQCFRVLDYFSWDDRRFRKWLRQHHAGNLEIKCRLIPMDASELQRRYSQPEGRPLVCLLTRIGKSIRVVMAERTSV